MTHGERMPLTDPRRLVPAGVRTEEFLLRPIRAADAARDFDAVVETRADLRVWEQSSWPDDDFTVEANRQDLEELIDFVTVGTSESAGR